MQSGAVRPAAREDGGLPCWGDMYLPLRALAKYSGLSVRSLRSHLTGRAHPLPHYRIGGKILVRRSDYDAWVTQFRANVAPTVDHVVDDLLGSLT
jgi:hypothetical protein